MRFIEKNGLKIKSLPIINSLFTELRTHVFHCYCQAVEEDNRRIKPRVEHSDHRGKHGNTNIYNVMSCIS